MKHHLLARLLLIATCSSALNASELPTLGQPAGSSLSPLKEQALGRTVYTELKATLDFSDDTILNRYLSDLGHRLAASLNQAAATPYTFFAVNDNSINAFALPGGYIGINTGLILMSRSESELAAVMAHEIAHVSQRHIARRYERGQQMNIASIAGLIAAAIIATQDAQAGTGAMAATIAGRQQALINFTRENEKEADAVGIAALANAGYDPQGMPSFFYRMGQQTRFNESRHLPEYLRTHPQTESRLVAARARADAYPYRQVVDSQQYHLVKARVKVGSFSDPRQAAVTFKKMLQAKAYADYSSAHYGLALSLFRLGEIQAAKTIYEQLVTQYPNQILFQQALATTEIALGQTTAALSRLAAILKNHPTDLTTVLQYAELLLQSGQIKTAIPLLSQHASKYHQADVYALLAKAYFANKQPALAHMAQAEYALTTGHTKEAVNQLKLAEKLPKNSAQIKAQIKARLAEIKSWSNHKNS